MNHLFIFGFGYVAATLAEMLRENAEWKISGTSRDAGKRLAYQRSGVELVDFSDQEGVEAALSTATHLLISIPPAKEERDDVLHAYAEALKSVGPHLQWVGYLSTTGVYPDANGEWVSEETPANPASSRGHVRLHAENAWLQLGQQTGAPVQIFRLSGIYGPGRNALEDVKRGTARKLVKAGHVFSRIHVADIACALQLSMSQPTALQIYNVSDDAPAPSADVIDYAAQLLGIAPPPFEDVAMAEISPMMREFYSASRRVSNAKLKAALGWQPEFPSYREGLQAILLA